MANVHATAIVDAKARLHESVTVGPFSVVGPDVQADEGVQIGPHAVVLGLTHLQRNARVFQFASVGDIPQDLKFKGEPGRVIIGPDTQLREFVSIHIGTATGRMETRVGARCLVMANSHIAHDCVVEDDVIIAGGSMLAGHVTVATQAIVSGLVGIHQFTRIGRNAFVAGGAMVTEDVVPYCFAHGDRARLRGLNLEGLKRRGATKEVLQSIKDAYRVLFREKRTLADGLAELGRTAKTDEARAMLEFCAVHKRALMRP